MIAPDLVRRARGRIDLELYATGVRSSESLTLPYFLGIGAQKAGTTWLHENLARHPDLFLAPAKELHHFDWFRQGTLRRYAACFANRGERIAGEITPGYSALRGRRVGEVRAVLGDARILLLLRDPVERAWSQARMDVRQSGRRIEELEPAEVLAHLRRRGARRRGDYPEMLAAWESAFGDGMWVGFFDDIVNRPQALLEEVLTHLGVSTELPWDQLPLRQPFNPGGDETMPTVVRDALRSHYAPDITALRGRFGDRVAEWGD